MEENLEKETKKVLVVDDEQAIIDVLVYNLQKEGYETLEATDGVTAVNIALEQKPDLMLLDIMLPKMDGLTVCKRVKNYLNIPILMLTAKDAEIDKIVGLELGADDYITKPFRVRELISRINAILRRKGKSQDSNKKILKFKNISIHTLEARVFKNNEEIFLTSAEYKLLLILIQNKNMVLSRAQILEKLWDVTYDFINDNTLSVYIKRLREKIEDDSSKPQYILTVRGLGYKWNGSDDNENTI